MKSKYSYFVSDDQAIQFEGGVGYWRHFPRGGPKNIFSASTLSLSFFQEGHPFKEVKRKEFFQTVNKIIDKNK